MDIKSVEKLYSLIRKECEKDSPCSTSRFCSSVKKIPVKRTLVKKKPVKRTRVKRTPVKKEISTFFQTPEVSVAVPKILESVSRKSISVPRTSVAVPKVKKMIQDIEEKIMKEKNPSVSFLKASIKKVESPVEETRFVEEVPMKLVQDYVENVFKKVSFKYKKCDDLEDYKEVLKKKCIKFLGYDSPGKTSKCVKERFRWLFRDNKNLSKNLDILGCKY